MGAQGCVSHYLWRVQLLIAMLSVPSPLILQGSASQNPLSTPHLDRRAVTSKLTNQQNQGLLLVQAAEQEAGGLDPVSRAFVLWQVSHGYKEVDRRKSTTVLNNAFQATLSIPREQNQKCSEAEGCEVKQWLQSHILRELIETSQRLPELQLAKAEQEVRHALAADIFHYYVDHRQFDKSRRLLDQLASEDSYPYDAVGELVSALPRQRDPEKALIFSEALSHFIQAGRDSPGEIDGLCTLILTTWRELPPALVLQAIGELLDAAAWADKSQHNVRVEVSSDRGDAFFSTQYDAWLFQLLPIIRWLDSDKAQDLLERSDELKSALERYPQGLRSTNTGAQSVPSNVFESVYVVGKDSSAEGALMQMNSEIVRREQQIERESVDNPSQAFLDAMDLPLTHPLAPEESPRATALMEVAREAARGAPNISKRAMQGIRKLNDIPLSSKALLLGDLPDIYIRIGDEEGARDTLDELSKIAAQLFERDNDPNDPNQAFKAMWPSTNVWRQCIKMAARLDPSLSDEIIQDTPDPDIRAFERIALANSLLGVGNEPLSIIERHKDSERARIIP
jgi:hypothetical protein